MVLLQRRVLNSTMMVEGLHTGGNARMLVSFLKGSLWGGKKWTRGLWEDSL